MPLWDSFPFTDFHQLNLDWIIRTMKEQVQAIADDKQYIDGKVAEFTQALEDFETAYNALLSLSNTFTESATKITFSKNIEAPIIIGQCQKALELYCRVPDHDDCNECISDDRTHVSFWRGTQLTNRPADIPALNNVMIMSYPVSNIVGSEVDGQILVNDYNVYVYRRSYDHATSTWSSWSTMEVAEASHATTADSATTAASATNATYATSAGTATTATNATNATYATSAGSAATATNADQATNATHAEVSGHANYAATAGIANNLPLNTSVTSNDANDYCDGDHPITIYHTNTLSSNVPSAVAGSKALIVSLAVDTGNIVQLAWFYTEGNNIYIRTKALNSWQAWRKFTLTNA